MVSVSVDIVLAYRTSALNFIPLVFVGPCRPASSALGSRLPGLLPQKMTPPFTAAPKPGGSGA
jgi:hypothetical protein